MKPLLAQTYEPHRVTYPCYVQPKLNGIRALYQAERFQSRDGVPFPVGLLDHLASPLLRIFGNSHAPLDGELYVHGWPLQRINAAVTPVRQEPTEDTLKVEYHVFDQVEFSTPFYHRVMPLLDSLFDLTQTHLVPFFKVNGVVEADTKYAMFISHGYEGMMYRLGDCPYTMPKQPNTFSSQMFGHGRVPWQKNTFLSDQNNRCWHLLKRKDWQDDEFDFVSLRETEGDLGFRGFIMTLRSKSSTKPTFDVGSGLSQSELDHYLQEPPTGRKVKVKYLVLSQDNIPLNPTILAIL